MRDMEIIATKTKKQTDKEAVSIIKTPNEETMNNDLEVNDMNWQTLDMHDMMNDFLDK